MLKPLYSSLLLFATFSSMAADSPCRLIQDPMLRLECYDKQAAQDQREMTNTVLDERIAQELASINRRFSLMAHRPTYILPITYANDPNSSPFNAATQSSTNQSPLDELEVKYQVSFKVPINRDFIFENSHLWFAYTQLSLWQLYDSDNSAPFRETNYEPELIWSFLVNQSFGELKLTHLAFALNHQSNGRSEPLSRSWNRIYLNTIWAYDNWAFSLRPWYRLPENDKDDDNPDIDDFLGHFDIQTGYKNQDHQFSSLFRSAFDGDRTHSYYELGYSFTLHRKIRAYVQFSSGYGESLIDYNHRNKRFGIGIMLYDWF